MKLVLRIDANLNGRFQTLFQNKCKIYDFKENFRPCDFSSKISLTQKLYHREVDENFCQYLAYVVQTFGIGLIFDEKSHGRFFRNFKLFPKKV